MEFEDRDIILLTEALRKNRRFEMICGVIIIMGGLFLNAIPSDLPPKTQFWLQCVSVLFFLGGGYLIIQAFNKLSIHEHPVLKELFESPENIVWAHPHIAINMPWGFHLFKLNYLMLRKSDGDTHTIRIPISKNDEIMNALRDRLPHATFGYSAEKDQLYRVDPEMLRR